MVGREIYDSTKQNRIENTSETVLEVKGLSRKGALRDINFKLRKGEIIGFAGLIGAGRTEVARAIFGADPIDAGEISVRGRKVVLRRSMMRCRPALDTCLKTASVMAVLWRWM